MCWRNVRCRSWMKSSLCRSKPGCTLQSQLWWWSVTSVVKWKRLTIRRLIDNSPQRNKYPYSHIIRRYSGNSSTRNRKSLLPLWKAPVHISLSSSKSVNHRQWRLIRSWPLRNYNSSKATIQGVDWMCLQLRMKGISRTFPHSQTIRNWISLASNSIQVSIWTNTRVLLV